MPSEAALSVIASGEAITLYEEKLTRVRGEMGHAERATRTAVEAKDAVLHEVTTLHQAKDALMTELAQLKTQGETLKAMLAEHRKNVEASLAKQEAAANVVIEQAEVRQAACRAHEASLRQFSAQVAGVQQTVGTVLTTALASVTHDLQALVQLLTEIKVPAAPTP